MSVPCVGSCVWSGLCRTCLVAAAPDSGGDGAALENVSTAPRASSSPGPRQPPPCRMSWKWSPPDAAFRVRLHSRSVSVRRARAWQWWRTCGLGSGWLAWREHTDFPRPGGWEAKAPTDGLSAEAAILGEPILGPLIRAGIPGVGAPPMTRAPPRGWCLRRAGGRGRWVSAGILEARRRGDLGAPARVKPAWTPVPSAVGPFLFPEGENTQDWGCSGGPRACVSLGQQRTVGCSGRQPVASGRAVPRALAGPSW